MNRLTRTVSFTVLGAGLAAGYFGWQHYSQNRDWALQRPALPALTGDSSPGLDARLQASARRLETWPPNLPALIEFTRVCHANGAFESAISGYGVLVILQPAEPRWPYSLAAILAGYGRLDEALPLLKRAVAMAPDYVPARLKLGEALLKANDLPGAEQAFAEVLRREAENPHAMLGLARCSLEADRLTAARAQLQRLVTAHPDFTSAQSLLGSVFERLGNTQGADLARARVRRGGHYPDPADPWINALIAECHDPYTLLIAASAALADKRPQDALPILERGLALAPQDARLHRQLGKTRAFGGDLVAARAELEQAVNLDPTNDAIHLDLLIILRRVNDPAALEAAIARASAACPTSAALRYEAGLIASRAGRLEEATNHLEYAWRTQPDQTAAAFEAAVVRFRRAQPAEAIALLEDVLARYPEDGTASLMLLRHGIEVGDARTDEWLARATASNPAAPALAELRETYQRCFSASR